MVEHGVGLRDECGLGGEGAGEGAGGAGEGVESVAQLRQGAFGDGFARGAGVVDGGLDGAVEVGGQSGDGADGVGGVGVEGLGVVEGLRGVVVLVLELGDGVLDGLGEGVVWQFAGDGVESFDDGGVGGVDVLQGGDGVA